MEVFDTHCHLEKGKIRDLLKEMNKYKIKKAIICPSRNYIAVENREGNSYIAKAVKISENKLIGFSVSNPWYGKKAIEELRRAHELGLSGLKINSALQGFSLIDPMIFPLIKMAQRFNWPVYCHMGTPVYSMPFQLCELALRFEDVTFIMGHGSFSDFWYDVPSTLRRCSNIYLETSYIPLDQILFNLKEFGMKRIIFGSDFPFSTYHLEIKKIELLKIEEKEKAFIYKNNIEQIIGGKK